MILVNKCVNILHGALFKIDLFYFYMNEILSNFTFVTSELIVFQYRELHGGINYSAFLTLGKALEKEERKSMPNIYHHPHSIHNL